MRNWSAIYSAPGGANGSEPNERLQRFDLNRCNGSTQQSHMLAVQHCDCWLSNWSSLDPNSGAGLVRVCSQPIPERSDSKRTRPGRELELEPEPRPGPEPEPGPAPAPAGRRQRRRSRARTHVRAGIDPSQSRAKTPSTQRARPLFSIFSIYTPQTSIPWPMWD